MKLFQTSFQRLICACLCAALLMVVVAYSSYKDHSVGKIVDSIRKDRAYPN